MPRTRRSPTPTSSTSRSDRIARASEYVPAPFATIRSPRSASSLLWSWGASQTDPHEPRARETCRSHAPAARVDCSRRGSEGYSSPVQTHFAPEREDTTVILEENYTLSNGLDIPKIGLGTWFIDNDDVAQAVRDATTIGYRHIDTAQAYGNEAGIGEGVRSCGVPREQIFVTTKLAAEVKSFTEAVEAIDGSLARTGLDYLDMMIIHSPQPW